MNSSCVGCLKGLVVSLHFLCWLCGAFVVAFGEFQMMHSRFASLVTTFWPIYPANTLVVTGTIVTCVCYLGVLGGLKENRCMLTTFYVLLFILMLVELAMACVFFVYNREIDTYFEKDLTHSLEVYMESGPEGNKTIKEDFDSVQYLVNDKTLILMSLFMKIHIWKIQLPQCFLTLHQLSQILIK
ncbi:leukocyte surface antigen CD53-like [Poecilia latipinna]|uniref:Leukocyte surface antigen CD53-like n=1 Tax=Poecilia latipinna TaxID=48699 RepID=A0A3B3TMN2_9TELE|nr:PREDICTED: leukocyte surface antigen CD53-like [Poecilia latipinna]XP_014882709.1 PREDICTED: leukocyte surface antigen CD53-like [Poecilia latipinna]